MQVITRHGGGSHFVRPDRVYRTGVLSSTMGYDPGADAQSVAASFTQYPMDLQLAGLNGNFFQKLSAKFKAWRMAHKMGGMRGLRGLGDPNSIAANSAYERVGQQIAPHLVSQEKMLAYLMRGSLPQNYARAQAAQSWHRWSNPWFQG